MRYSKVITLINSSSQNAFRWVGFFTVTKESSANEILRELYLERKERNGAYSTRAFARDLGVSQAYVSLLLNGKKPVSLKQATRIAALLNLSQERSQHLLNAVLSSEKTKAKKSMKIAWVKSEPQTWVIDQDIDRFALISHWYHLALLDLTTTQNFVDDLSWIAARLKITVLEAGDALDRLLRLGMLKRIDGVLVKTDYHYSLKTHKSEAAVRKFHRELIQKASDTLDDTSQEAFQKRSITGVTMAVNKDRLEIAKLKIRAFQDELTTFLTEGECTEVYQLNVQLFSLTHAVK